jgi:hypothetical protein
LISKRKRAKSDENFENMKEKNLILNSNLSTVHDFKLEKLILKSIYFEIAN